MSFKVIFYSHMGQLLKERICSPERCFLDNGNRLYCSKFVFIDTDMCTNNLRTSVHLLFVCFIALRSKSTAMVMVGRSVHLTTLFPRQA